MRARGFLEWAEGYIHTNPGLTAQEIAQKCLDKGIVASTAQNPVASLVATLHKHHSDQGRYVVRRKEFGVYRFYPSNSLEDVVNSPRMKPAESTSAKITSDQLQQYVSLADELIDVGKFETQADALVWLIQKR